MRVSLRRRDAIGAPGHRRVGVENGTTISLVEARVEGVYEFIANTADGAVAIDRRQTIVLWNPAARTILGYDPDEVVGRKCYEVLRGHDAEGCARCRRDCEMFLAASHLEPPPTMEISSTRSDGASVWLSVSSIVVPSPRHGLSVLVHLFREVTRRRELLQMVRDLAPSAEPAGATEDPVVAPDLTHREREILAHLAAGRSTEAIAERLFLSEHTVRNHIANILGKLGVHSRLEAATFAIRNRLV